ncbi:MAG: hypothetical protein ACRELA_22435 [Candidatus Rokuibacteriota bacterium]
MSIAAGLWTLGGCAAAGRMEGPQFVVRPKGYRVMPPTGWERLDSKADLALRHRTLEAGLMAHGTCDGRTPRRVPAVLARHLRFGLRDVRDLDEAPAAVAGRSGVQSRFTARLDGTPVAVRAVTVTARDCAYDLIVVAPPDRVEQAAEDFARFVDSFTLIGNAEP